MRCIPLHNDKHVGHGLLIALFVTLFWSTAAQAAADLGIGLVRAVEGGVVAHHDDERRVLGVGATVNADDVIETDSEGSVRIVFHDGTVLMAGADTRLSIDEYDPHGAERGLLSLLAGIVRTKLSSFWDSDFSVETRATIASVRSTDWITIADPDRGSIFVVSGTVGVTATATGESTALATGFGIDVDVGAGLPAAREWPDERVERTLSRLPAP